MPIGLAPAKRWNRGRPAAVALPAWRQGQAVGEWREIAGSQMTVAVPTNTARQLNGAAAFVGPVARMNAWCGLSIDTRTSKVWSVANGGHGDYFGNEVCCIDLSQNNPAWVEWCPGSSGDVVDNVTGATDPSRARYCSVSGDVNTRGLGLPASSHSYYGQQFIERQNRAVRWGGSMSPVGGAYENGEGFNVLVAQGVNGWDAPNTFGFCLGGSNGGWTPAIGWCMCKHPTTEEVFAINAPNVWKFTPNASTPGGTWTLLGNTPTLVNSGALGATAVDTARNRILWLLGYGPTYPYTVDVATGEWTARSSWPSTTARDELISLPGSLGLVYEPSLDAFFVRARAAGGKIFRIDPVTFEVSYYSTSGGSALPEGAVLTGEQGVFNRFLRVPAYGGVVYFPKAQENAWFLRLI